MEYNLIIRLGYENYFLIVWDISRYAREHGILGTARGSVAGSLLAFLIGITDVDPIRFDLMFERFLNETRAVTDPPDVDLDFQSSKRNQIKQYIIDKYGSDRVSSIGSYSRMYSSGAIKDVAKALGLDYHSLNKAIARRLYDMTLEEAYESVDTFKQWVDRDEGHKRCFDIALQLEGLVRHRTVHPAGMVITPGSLEEYLPVYKVGNTICTQWKDIFVAKRGILKVDILGVSTWDVISSALDFIEEQINLLDIPLDDSGVLDTFTRGETLAVFQFEAHHLQKIIKMLRADRFEDLVVATTIARPGAHTTGIMDSVIRRKHGEEKVEYPHESVKQLLADTYGHPIYQELIMKMANIAGNIPLVDTEIMRAAMKKESHEVMGGYQEQFMAGSKSNGIPMSSAARMWEMIQASSKYGFNKSHSVSYSLLSYFCAYLKYHYPLEYMTACLKHEGSSDKIPLLMNECKRLGLSVRPVDINKSEVQFTTDGESIYCGFTVIKHIGEKAAQEIVTHQPFKSKRDLLDRVNKRSCNKKIINSLEEAGVFSHGEVSPIKILNAYGCLVGELPDLDLDDLDNCSMCDLCDVRYKVVEGCGSQLADIMFVGEAPGCVSGNSLIDVAFRNKSVYPKGIPIKDLVGKKDFYVYSYDVSDDSMVLGKVNRVWKTGRKKVYKVTYEWRYAKGHNTVYLEDSMNVTSNHRFLLKKCGWRDPFKGIDYGEERYISIDEGLQVGASLQPFYRSQPARGNARIGVSSNDRKSESRFLLSYKIGEESVSGEQCHHIDRDTRNDSYENIELHTVKSHSRLHIEEDGNPMSNPNVRQKHLVIVQSEHYRKKHSIIMKEILKDPVRYSLRLKQIQDTNEARSNTVKKLFQNPQYYWKYLLGRQKQYNSLSNDWVVKKFQERFPDVEQPIDNHKVISIEYIGKEDVYDMEVEKYHNFAVNGIFVHNSTEDRTGTPFIGRAGRLLRGKWIIALGLRPSEVWITNIVKCAPKSESGGKIGKPSDNHIAICTLWLEKEIDIIKPRVIVALGSFSLQQLSMEKYITRMHGETFDIVTKYAGKREGITGYGLFHPAYILRNKEDVSKELKGLKQILEEL